MEDDLWLTVLGGGIAGGIGILTFSFQQWRTDRRKLDEEALVPAFNYVNSLPNRWPWDYIQEPDWYQLDSYTWYKLPTKFRRELDKMRNELKTHNETCARWLNLIGGAVTVSFRESIEAALSRYVNGGAIQGKKMGIESGATFEIERLVPGVLPYILLNPHDPDRAWDELGKIGGGTSYWASIVTEVLRKNDPSALKNLFGAITSNPNASECRRLAESALRTFQSVIQESMVARELLAKRLNIKGALKAATP